MTCLPTSSKIIFIAWVVHLFNILELFSELIYQDFNHKIFQSKQVQMGSNISTSLEIKVGTLNFSGMNYSPFEFYSGDQAETKQLEELGRIFHQLIKMEFKKPENQNLKTQFDWGIGQIDKVVQLERYTPIYQQKVGWIGTGIMSRKQFQERWEFVFQKCSRDIFQKKNKKYPSKEEIQKCKRLDFLLFKTFVQYICSQHKNLLPVTLQDRENEQMSSNNICQEYEQFMKKFFQKEYLNDSNKVLSIIGMLQKNDIFFLQDFSKQAKSKLEQKFKKRFHINWDPTSHCAIVITKEHFPSIFSFEVGIGKYGLEKQLSLTKGRFNYYYDQPTLVVFSEVRGYIFLFVSLHLSSGLRKEEQIPDFMNHMIQLKNIFKSHQRNLNIVVGGDFNDFIGKYTSKNEGFYQQFRFSPQEEKQSTTIKKRTALHTQMKKTDHEDRKCRNFIVTHLNIVDEDVVTSQGQKSDTIQLLPTNQNPFDHFVVQVTIKFGWKLPWL